MKISTRSNKPVTSAFLIFLLLTACASKFTNNQEINDQVATPVSGNSSVSGNYLAGRHAQVINETSKATMYFSNALKLAPSSQSLLQRTFLMMASEGRIYEALPLAQKVLRQNPKAPVANLTVIVGDIEANHLAEAMKKIRKLPDGGLNDFIAPLLAAWISIAQGQAIENAMAYLIPLKKEGSKSLYYLHKAIILDFKGDHKAATEAYLQKIKEHGSLVLRVAQLLGNLYERSGEIDKATALYKKFAQKNPNSSLSREALSLVNTGIKPKPIIGTALDGAAESFFGIATSLSQQNAKKMALFFSRLGLYLRSEFPVMKILLSSLLQSEGQLENANTVLLSIDKSSIYSWPARLNLAENLNDLGQIDEAINILRAMAKEKPRNVDSLIKLGDIFRVHKRFIEAQTAYDQALKRVGSLQSHHWSLLYTRGIVLERTKQWEKAEADFLRALEFNPDQPSVLNYLGYSWVDQGKNLERATEMIQKAVSLRPNDGYIVDSIGWAYFKLGEFAKSVKELERAVELRPEDPILNDHLGDAFWRVGRRLEAHYQWNRALLLKPENKLRIQINDKLVNGLPDLIKNK